MKAIELKAVGWFCKQNDLKPALSVPPFQMNFTDKTTGLEKTAHLDFIMSEYNAWKSEDQKRRAKERRMAKKS